MALQVWLPLNGDLRNQGLANVSVTNSGATVDNAGKIGKCYSFNNANLLQISTLNIGDEFSIAYWVKYNDLSYPRTHVGIQHSSGAYTSTNKGWDIGHGPSGGGTYNFDINDGTNIQMMSFSPSNITQLNIWKHFTLTCSLSNKSVKLYIDGVLVGTQTINNNIGSFSTNRVTNIGTLYGWYLNGYLNDFRIYDHCLSPKEVKEISKGLVLHYKLDDPYVEATTNLGNTSATYSNISEGATYTNPGSWGGTTGTITYYHSGGYNNYPYKVYHRTAAGSGGFYYKTSNDITIIAGKTYTVSCYMKCSKNVSNFSMYSFNINRGSDNNYITCGSSFSLTTEWQRKSFTFTATSAQAGSYGEMSIIYGSTSTTENIDVYYSGFQIEEKDHATPYTPSSRSGTLVYDYSGYNKTATPIDSTLVLSTDTPRYQHSTQFDGNTSGILIEDIKLSNILNTAATFSFWIKPNGENSNRSIYCGCYNNTYVWNIEKTAGNVLRWFWNWSIDVSTSVSITDGSWQHIAITKNGTSEVKFYKNGALVQTITTQHQNLEFPDMFRIGRDQRSGDGTPYKGLMSDFRIYSTALSADDVKELYNTSAYIYNDGTVAAMEAIEKSTDNVDVTKTGQVATKYFIECDDYLYLPAGAYVDTGLYYNLGDTCKAQTIIRYSSGGSGRDLMGFSPSAGGYWGVTSGGAWEPHGTFSYTNSDITKLNNISYEYTSSTSVTGDQGNYKVGCLGNVGYTVRNKYIYNVKLYKNGTLERDLYPAFSGSTCGLVDALHGVFYAVTGSGALLGNDEATTARFYKDHIQLNQIIEI